MALTFTSKDFPEAAAHGNLRSWKPPNGPRIQQVEMTVGVTGDYSAGFEIDGNKAALGFAHIFDVNDVSIRDSGGGLKALMPFFDHTTGKLRLYLETFVEITPAVSLAIGDLVGNGLVV